MSQLKIIIIGAGSIGAYIGSILINKGYVVKLIARNKLIDQISSNKGITITNNNKTLIIPQSLINITTSLSNLSDYNIIIFTCKLKALKSLAEEVKLKSNISNDASIFSFQNGLISKSILASIFPENFVSSCMVGLSVNWFNNAHFYLGSDLPIVIEEDSSKGRNGHKQLLSCLLDCGVNTYSAASIEPILRAKLLINTNNSVNALCGLSLRDNISDPYLRAVWALLIEEGLKVYDANKLPVSNVGKLHLRFAPFILRLPNFLFKIVASSMIKLDSRMVSSMQTDILQNKKTEIDYLCGEIISLASKPKTGTIPTPCNSKMLELIHKMENEDVYRPYSPYEIHHMIAGNVQPSSWRYSYLAQKVFNLILYLAMIYIIVFVFIRIIFN